MRVPRFLSLISALLLLALPARPQIPGSRAPTDPHPLPGKVMTPADLPRSKQVPADVFERPAIDIDQLHREAQELADLSASIRSDVNQVSQGVLPKELLAKLKRVEKLSKHLRSQLGR